MQTLAILFHVFVSIFLILIVLLQTGKGASMGSAFGGTSNQTVFGSSGPTSLLSKLTVFCAIVFMLTSLYLAYVPSDGDSIVENLPTQEAPPEEGK
jgi:preprotein translocase subunit SecG